MEIFKLTSLELVGGDSISLALLISELLFSVFIIFVFLFYGCEKRQGGNYEDKINN